MGVIVINGREIVCPDGARLDMIGGKVYINDVLQESSDPPLSGIVRVLFTGNLLNVKLDRGDIECGNIQGNASASGDIKCDNVGGNVAASGDVRCGDVGGNISSSGDVNCAKVGGKITTTGDVTHR
jgi:hypothetical protein